MQELLEIRVLGPFEVLVGQAPADVGGSKRQALLAMLALRNGRPVEIDALVDGLWGEELPAAPRNALHHHIARLRAEPRRTGQTLQRRSAPEVERRRHRIGRGTNVLVTQRGARLREQLLEADRVDARLRERVAVGRAGDGLLPERGPEPRDVVVERVARG